VDIEGEEVIPTVENDTALAKIRAEEGQNGRDDPGQLSGVDKHAGNSGGGSDEEDTTGRGMAMKDHG
jgi:hypothetical protein